MPLLVGIIVVALAAVAALYAGIARLKENGAALEHATRELILRLEALEGRMEQAERSSKESLSGLREELRLSAREGREEVSRNIWSLGETQSKHLKDIAGLQKEGLELFAGQLLQLTRSNEAKQESLRAAVEAHLKEMRAGNEEKLEKMRVLVDEKLHTALEQRLGAAFSNVSEWLDKVHRGLGEMKNLATDVGDLRKVLTNVKTRGTWGEIQLGALLDQILNKEQYEKDIAVIPGASERVEFAVRLPGAKGEEPVWLPIDSKFPQEDYLRIVEASESCNPAVIAESRKALEQRVLGEAKKIRDKYVEPPYTTDFGILYLPVEGLYSEILRIDGLCERLMRDYRVVVSGPTTVAALLNSLQLGFRTLAIEKRSSEVWVLLGQVKTEFSKFGTLLEKVQNKIEQAGKELEGAGRRTRAIERKLRDVAELPSDELASELSALNSAIGEGEDDE